MTRAAGPLAAGGAAGLAWAAGLRGLMVEVAGRESAVHWYGTFVQILLPGVVTGALFGWAWHTRRRRWLVAAPLVFPIAVIVSPDTVTAIAAGRVPFSDGLGGGALALPLFGMAGGYAIAGHVRWRRIVLGVFALVPLPAWAIASASISPALSVTTARGAWVAALFWASTATLALGCAIPLARAGPTASRTAVRDEVPADTRS
ncbi:hypothetical protein [Amycolatopsis australiensis]|uniref:Uncharacterized protein n=1 Tax=Amycolatopsis australiensis TaxID=546364 RepID=A0A1K1SLU1_9PSEU|nr:hypothetical protein [Amycolatopsis australiensis]SFW85055.1 hypothetical protein SAMN04489730_6031 [Amycolatopsis australiensis]